MNEIMKNTMLVRCVVLIFLLSTLLPTRNSLVTQSLRENSWKCYNANASIQIDAKVPGGIYTDLQNAGILREDIMRGYNDALYRWVAMDNWTYVAQFSTDEDMLKMDGVELVVKGVDTFASIYLNDEFVGNISNMFVRYRFDVKRILRVTNILKVLFESAITKSSTLARQHPYPIPPECTPKKYNGECHVNFARKMQASFGWDWGPAFPSVGIWKGVEIVGYDQNSVTLRDVTVTSVQMNSIWIVNVTACFEGPRKSVHSISGILAATLNLDGNRSLFFESEVTLDTALTGEVDKSLIFHVAQNDVELWYPNGYGSQKLYPLNVSFYDSDKRNMVTKLLRIGFRSVELVQEPVSNNASHGLSFYFRVNGIALFAKGSNVIPIHILPEAATRKTVRELLRSAKLAHMNMIRVWGGGIYQSDYFYRLCDKYGIMVWQDMMFACNMYPVDEDFTRSVEMEVKQQVRRLQHHASIVVWAGNNENEAALSHNWYGTDSNFDLYKREYIKLYVNTVKSALLNSDTSRPFLTSSPTNGIRSDMEGYVAKDPYNSKYGDVHYYNYLVNPWNQRHYPRTRFCSEYGLQSFPSYNSLQRMTTSVSDLNDIDSDFLSHRQHLEMGNSYLLAGLRFNFDVKQSMEVKDIVYLSQVNQAWSIKTQTEFYRSRRSVLDADGSGHTMGALYWQLNDVWQAPSWSSIEYSGKWKMLHYYAKNFFSPVIIATELSNDNITISVVSDKLEDIPGAVLRIDIYSWDTLSPAYTTTYNVSLLKQSSMVVASENIHRYLSSAEACAGMFPQDKCFWRFELTKNGKNISPTNYAFPSTLKYLIGYKSANVKVELLQIKTNKIRSRKHRLKITTDAIALFFWLEANNIDGYFSDNGFILTTSTKYVYFYSNSPIFPDDLIKNISFSKLEKI